MFKRKKRWYRLSLREMLIVILCGIFFSTSTLFFCITKPAQAVVMATQLGICAMRIRGDVKKTVVSYLPDAVKATNKKVETNATRYGVRDSWSLMGQSARSVGVKVYAPKPSIWVRMGNFVASGVMGLAKVVVQPLNWLFG